MRSYTSGVRTANLAKCDVVDIIHIDGDIHAVGNQGGEAMVTLFSFSSYTSHSAPNIIVFNACQPLAIELTHSSDMSVS